MRNTIEFHIENGKNGMWFLVVKTNGRLATDEVNEIVREYELARLRRSAEYINRQK